jgi:hypothetical protein
MTPDDRLTAALVVLARRGVPTDVLVLLTHGDGRGTVAPGALKAALDAAMVGAFSGNARHPMDHSPPPMTYAEAAEMTYGSHRLRPED